MTVSMFEPNSDIEEDKVTAYAQGFADGSKREDAVVARLRADVVELQHQLVSINKWCAAARMALAQVQRAADMTEKW